MPTVIGGNGFGEPADGGNRLDDDGSGIRVIRTPRLTVRSYSEKY